jgi:endosialidase-like protein
VIMQGFRNVHFLLFALIALIWSSSLSSLQAQTTSFTYQGRLIDGGVPANGVYDLQFKLFDAPSAGMQQGGTVLRDDVSVTGGTFSVILDFGAPVFSGANRWLEVSVRPGASTDAYTTLSPLQPITSTPYAIKSLSAATADGLSVGCANCVTSVQIANGTIVDANVSPTAAINPTKIAGTAATLGAANAFTGPLTINSSTGVVLPDPDNPVAAFASQFSGSSGIGVAVAGVLTDPNVQGAAVAGITKSPNSLAGFFRNAVPGPILVAATSNGQNDADIFSVFGTANAANGKVGINTEDALSTLTVRGIPPFAALTGTVSVTQNSNVVTGTGTQFGSEVGIGDRITNPANGETRVVLQVNSNTNLNTTSNWITAASGTFNNSAAVFRVDDATGPTRLILDSTGALGVGVLAPIANLDVAGRSLFRNRFLVSSSGSNQKPSLLTVRSSNFPTITGTVSVTSGSTTVTGSGQTNFTVAFGPGDRITVGTTPPETHTIVAITDNIHLTVDTAFTNSATTATLTPIPGLFRADDASGNSVFLINDTGNVGIGGSLASLLPTERLQVFGNIRVGTDVIDGCVKTFSGSVIGGTCSSDERLKKDIQPFAPLMSKLVQLRPVSYNWKADENPEYHFGSARSSGLVAQEVEKVFPEMVATDEHGFKAVNYSQLPLMLLQAVKELKDESDHRESELRETVKQQQTQIQQLLSVVEKLQNH